MRDWTAHRILEVLDQCCDSFKFPMLDNGYVYLAASRLSLYRSDTDWGLVIEIFGFSPRAGLPDTHIYTFSSNLSSRKSRGDFVSENAYGQYISNNPYNESNSVYPIQEGDWIDAEDPELVAEGQQDVSVRGHTRPVPTVVEENHRSSNSETFNQLAEVLITGEAHIYKPTAAPNTHWKNWPEGGTL
jgi:hypothetical protein